MSNVYVLNGGLKAWGVRATDSEEVSKDDKNLEVNFDPSTLVYYDEILELINSEGPQIVDGRPAPAFEQGNIPGSKHLAADSFLTSENLLKTKDQIRLSFTEAGIDCDKPIVVSCRSGMLASLMYLAAYEAEMSVRLYDGSWSEFSAKYSQSK